MKRFTDEEMGQLLPTPSPTASSSSSGDKLPRRRGAGDHLGARTPQLRAARRRRAGGGAAGDRRVRRVRHRGVRRDRRSHGRGNERRPRGGGRSVHLRGAPVPRIPRRLAARVERPTPPPPSTSSGTCKRASANSYSTTSTWSRPKSRSARCARPGRTGAWCHRGEAVVRQRGHRTRGRGVDHQAGAAEALEIFEFRGRAPVEVQCAVELLGPTLSQVARTQAPSSERWSRRKRAISHWSTTARPRTSRARRRTGDIRSALACIACLPSQELVAIQVPDSRSTSSESPTAVERLQCGQDDVADMGDSNVDRKRLRLNGGRACVHGRPLPCRGSAPAAPPVSPDTFLLPVIAGNDELDFRGTVVAITNNWLVAGVPP